MDIIKRILNSKFKPLKRGGEYDPEYYKANRKASRAHQLKYKFGITLEEYDHMVQSQNGVCAICKGVSTTRKKGTYNGKDIAMSLAVDHNHKTGKVRGLLCTKCNTSLGQFKDDIALLKEAIKYLEERSENI